MTMTMAMEKAAEVGVRMSIDPIVRREMEMLKDVVLNNIRILQPHNQHDTYYSQQLARGDNDYFFETYLVIAWAAIKLKPRRIMEIGTRNGGSLVQLLSMYHRHDDLKIVCFDIWREIGGPKAVCRNLQLMNIPFDTIGFVSGDSRQTVPLYKEGNPTAQFDYILVDGCHDAPVAAIDLENVADMVAPGGILIFDDITPVSYNLIDVWRAFQARHEDQYHWSESHWRKGVAWGIRK